MNNRQKPSILGVDIGTTGLKMGVFSCTETDLSLGPVYSENYTINTYKNGLFGDVEPEKWKRAFLNGCKTLDKAVSKVDAVALSGTTPGMTAMDEEGTPLYPAILMLDQRSRTQAQRIIETVGIETLLSETGNMPVAGGCSLASILWLKENEPEVFRKTAVFGHSNTVFAKWLGGSFAIDPSSASLSALYNTVSNDYSWNKKIAGTFDISISRLPPVIPSDGIAGHITREIAGLTGIPEGIPVVIGGNDAVLAAYSAGIEQPGEIINVNGTCEITLVCLPEALGSRNYNIRNHVFPGRWLTLYVMNAGGKAFEWFREVFCSEMSPDQFFQQFVPSAVESWLERESMVTYIPYLMGSRYSLEPLRGGFVNLTKETTREEMLSAMVKGLYEYQREHVKEVAVELALTDTIVVTGGAVNDTLIKAKQKWMKRGAYVYKEQSSMLGAAMLGRRRLETSGGGR